MGFHVAVDTADNNKVIGAAFVQDRSVLTTGSCTAFPDNDEGLSGDIPQDLVDASTNPPTPRYQWNGAGIELIP